MTRSRKLILAMVVLPGACRLLAELPPHPKMTVHTWVREDIFAGYLANDIARLDRGALHADEWLAREPRNADALAWRAGAEFYRAVLAHEAGNQKGFLQRYLTADEMADKALEMAPDSVGVNVVIGGTMLLMADRLPPSERKAAYERGRRLYGRTIEIQKAFFDKMPVHHRGELLSGMALAADRLGDRAERNRVLQQTIATLAGTPYEGRAKKWMAMEGQLAEKGFTCMSCHEPGRQKPMLEKLRSQQ